MGSVLEPKQQLTYFWENLVTSSTPVRFDVCFDKDKIDEYRPLIPETYQVMEELAGRSVKWPNRIECMTPEQIREGRRFGAGHGLYLISQRRIFVNASMSARNIFLNFIHENLHHALPSASERKIDRLTPQVYHRVRRQ